LTKFIPEISIHSQNNEDGFTSDEIYEKLNQLQDSIIRVAEDHNNSR